MRPPKFNFIPERQIGKESLDSTFTVTVNKYNTIVFSKSDVEIYELENKFLKMFVDIEKKVIAWSVIEGKTDFTDISEARPLKKNTVSGVIVIGVKKLLNAIGTKITKSRKCPVKTYASPLHEDKIYYIELKETEDKDLVV